jgi:ABC-2 type transport system permease protein
MPWAQPERYGEIIWNGHLQGIISFAIPNTIVAGVLLYTLAVVFRSNIVSFVGAMLILVFYIVSQNFTSDIEKEWLANILDPFGFQPLSILTKYKTIEEKNLTAATLEGPFLLNRLVWVGISLLVLFGMYFKFSFNTGKEKVKKTKKKDLEDMAPELSNTGLEVRKYELKSSKSFSWSALFHMIKFETKAVIKNQVFIILVLIGLINLIGGLSSFSGNYGASKFPVTYDVIDSIRGAFYLFLVAIITFYTGVLVWKERDAKINEIEDATPIRTGMLFSSKLVAMMIAIFLVLCSTIVVGMGAQAAFGYFRFELPVYIKTLLVLDMFQFGYMVVIALLFHYLINNRYIAYFAFVAFLILNSFIWNLLEIRTNMLEFGSTPSVTYSDMNGFGPFVSGQVWFNIYWSLFSLLLCFFIYAFYVRGKETGFKTRWKYARQKIQQRGVWMIGTTLLFLVCGGFVFYNTKVLNEYSSSKEIENRRKEFELN